MPQVRICSLGSSFAAGPGIEAGGNYAHLLARELHAELNDLSSSGSTLANIYADPQSRGFSTRPPQIEGLRADTSIVTITAGGNDLGYSLGMLWDSLIANLGIFSNFIGLRQSAPLLDKDQLTARLRTTLGAVRQKAPAAHVYLVEYVDVFGPQSRPGLDTALDRGRVQHYIDQSRLLSKAYDVAAAEFEHVTVVPMAQLSRDHELGAADPWVTGFHVGNLLFGGVVPYHPNQVAHRAIATAILERVRG